MSEEKMKAKQEDMPALVLASIVSSCVLLLFGLMLLAEGDLYDDAIGFVLGVIVYCVLNIVVMIKYTKGVRSDNSSNTERKSLGMIGLYLKRKRLEEEKRIRDLEADQE